MPRYSLDRAPAHARKAATRAYSRKLAPESDESMRIHCSSSVTSPRRDGAWRAAGRAMPTKRPDDVLTLLTSQHAEVDDLFEKLGDNDGDRRALFAKLADTLAAHATVEETIFYPLVMSKETSDLLHESVEEHLEIKRVLADLITKELDGHKRAARAGQPADGVVVRPRGGIHRLEQDTAGRS